MFGSCHYVPVLRWKQAERLALSYLDDVDKEGMTPLVELPPRYFDDVAVQDFDATVVEIAADLTTSWGRRPVFVDLSKVPTNQRHSPPGHDVLAYRPTVWIDTHSRNGPHKTRPLSESRRRWQPRQRRRSVHPLDPARSVLDGLCGAAPYSSLHPRCNA